MIKHMTDEEIHNIYLHMSGKAEGIAEVTGTADFPVLFARAILEFDRMEREWVGLTDEEIKSCAKEHLYCEDSHYNVEDGIEGWKDFACAIEAKLKEKNT